MANADMTLLTHEQIQELTGASRAQEQIKVLARNGIPHIVGKDGKPRLTWYHVNHPRNVLSSNDDEPNFKALDRAS